MLKMNFFRRNSKPYMQAFSKAEKGRQDAREKLDAAKARLARCRDKMDKVRELYCEFENDDRKADRKGKKVLAKDLLAARRLASQAISLFREAFALYPSCKAFVLEDYFRAQVYKEQANLILDNQRTAIWNINILIPDIAEAIKHCASEEEANKLKPLLANAHSIRAGANLRQELKWEHSKEGAPDSFICFGVVAEDLTATMNLYSDSGHPDLAAQIAWRIANPATPIYHV